MTKTIPKHLLSTVQLLKQAYPNGNMDNDYQALIKVLYDDMSIRNLVNILKPFYDKPSHDIINDIYEMANLDIDTTNIKRKLEDDGYQDWLHEDISHDVIITWDKKVFDGVNTMLPSVKTLHSQLYLADESAWSLVFSFELGANQQGYETLAKVWFLVDDAPHHLLKTGFKFVFMHGGKVVGKCEIV